MPILYDNPKEVGADRVADAVGAYDLYGGPCVVVDLGTATTFEAISEAGEYLGGAITPGVAIASTRCTTRPPRSAASSWSSPAASSALDGRVDRVGHALRLRRAGRRPGPPLHGGARALHRGGHRRLHSLIAPYSETIEHVEPWLTLHGLRIVFERNVNG